MKKSRRLFALVAALLMIISVFTACTGAKDGSDKEKNADKKISAEEKTYLSDNTEKPIFDKENKENNENRLQSGNENKDNAVSETVTDAEQVTEDSAPQKKTLVMATNAQFPPYEYYDNGKLTGIDIEIAELIAQELGMELEIKDMDFSNVIVAVRDGEADIGMAGMVVTPERKKHVDFTDPYMKNAHVIVVMQGSGIESAEDLKGGKVGVVADSVSEIYAEDDFGSDNVVRYTEGSAAATALMAGMVDAIILSYTEAKQLAFENDSVAIIYTPYAKDYYSIAVSKENPELLNQINAAIAKLESEGKIQEIINKY